MDSLRSPVEILRSVGELLRRWIFSTWTFATVALAGVLYLVEHVVPGTHISDRLWLWIVAAGGAMSLAWAYHRTRMERDLARGGPIRPAHGKELTDRLNLHLDHVRNREPSYYVDAAPGGPADEASFCAHFRDRCAEIDRWNEAVMQGDLYGKVKEEIRREAESVEPGAATLDPDVFSVAAVVDSLWGWLLTTAKDGKLDEPTRLRWREHNLPDRCDLELEGTVVGGLPPGLPDELADRVQAARAQVFTLAGVIRGWDDARKITEGTEGAERLREPLITELDLDLRAAEDLRRSDACAVCQRHQTSQRRRGRIR